MLKSNRKAIDCDLVTKPTAIRGLSMPQANLASNIHPNLARALVASLAIGSALFALDYFRARHMQNMAAPVIARALVAYPMLEEEPLRSHVDGLIETYDGAKRISGLDVTQILSLVAASVRAKLNAELPRSIKDDDEFFKIANAYADQLNAYVRLCDHIDEDCSATLSEGPATWREWFEKNDTNDSFYLDFDTDTLTFQILKNRTVSIHICNLVPFRIYYALSYAQWVNTRAENGWWSLDAGQCDVQQHKFVHVAPAAAIYGISGAGDRAVSLLYGLADNDQRRAEFNVGVAHVEGCVHPFDRFDSDRSATRRPTSENFCPTDHVRVLYAELGPEVSINESLDEWHYNFYEPRTGLLSVDQELSYSQMMAEAKERAKALAFSLSRQVDLIDRYAATGVRYHFGAVFEDANGLLVPGVTISQVAERTIFGEPLQLQVGDVLFMINENVVYSAADALSLLETHATSRSGGIRIPYQAVVERAGSLLPVSTTFFYNEAHPDFFEDRAGSAALYGALNAITLGFEAEAACVGKNARPAAANGYRWFRRNFVPSALDDVLPVIEEPVEYANMADCVWEKEQEIGLLIQKHREPYDNVGLIAMVTPSAPRLILQRGLRRYLSRAVRSTSLRAALSVGALEALEGAILTVKDGDPTLSMQEQIEEAIRWAPANVAVGFIAGGLTSR